MKPQFGLVLVAALACSALASATTTHKSTSSSAKKTTSKSSSSKAHKSTSTAHSSSKSRRGKKTASKKSWKSKGQHAIASDRTREIQEALIREHYLSGEANGEWDSRTQEAMRRFQSQQGWQSKVLPDSRALIKLGLGPDHKNVLNPETAATSPYQPGGGEKSAAVIAPATQSVKQ